MRNKHAFKVQNNFAIILKEIVFLFSLVFLLDDFINKGSLDIEYKVL